MTKLIILPGLHGTGTLHAEFLSALSGTFERSQVLAYPSDETLGYAELETLVRAELPGSEPFVLLGESFSGPIALAIAAKPPAGHYPPNAIVSNTSANPSPTMPKPTRQGERPIERA